MQGLISWVLSRKFTEDTADSLGSLKGAPCEIQSIVYDQTEKTVTITFSWTGTSGQVQTDSVVIHDGEKGDKGDTGATGAAGKDGKNGLGIKHSYVDENEHFIIVYDDDTEEDCGKVTVLGASVDTLSDVDITDPTDGQALVYDAEKGKWVNGEGGGSGDASLESNVTSNMAVGAIASGTTLAEGTTFTEFVQKLLITEIAPTTTFTASGSGVKEVGTSVTPTLTLVINTLGTGTPTAIKFYDGSTLLDTQSYVDGTTSYTFTMDAVTTTKTVKGVLEYKKSDESNATLEKSATYTFVMASYYGAVATAPTDKAGITALTKNVKNTKALTTTFTLSNQRSCYCYPASFGNLSSIKDANNFEYLSSYTKTNVTVDEVSYNVYTLTDPVTATGFKQVYA